MSTFALYVELTENRSFGYEKISKYSKRPEIRKKNRAVIMFSGQILEGIDLKKKFSLL